MRGKGGEGRAGDFQNRERNHRFRLEVFAFFYFFCRFKLLKTQEKSASQRYKAVFAFAITRAFRHTFYCQTRTHNN